MVHEIEIVCFVLSAIFGVILFVDYLKPCEQMFKCDKKDDEAQHLLPQQNVYTGVFGEPPCMLNDMPCTFTQCEQCCMPCIDSVQPVPL